MMVDREKLEALVWRRIPAELKVCASGMKFVSVDGSLNPLASLSDATLFTVLRKTSAVKLALKALDTMEAA